MDSYAQALRNLESRLAMALNSATQAEHDLNTVRLRAGLPPIQYFHLSAAVAQETNVGPKGGAKRSVEDADDDVVNLMLDASRFRRGEVVSVAEARRQRLSAEKDRRR
jgi:hypothetical protein